MVGEIERVKSVLERAEDLTVVITMVLHGNIPRELVLRRKRGVGRDGSRLSTDGMEPDLIVFVLQSPNHHSSLDHRSGRLLRFFLQPNQRQHGMGITYNIYKLPSRYVGAWKVLGPRHVPSEYTSIEVTATDQPGLLSEISAVLSELECYVVPAQAWTHNSRAAMIMYLTDQTSGTTISDPERIAYIEEQVGSVLRAHLGAGVRVLSPGPRKVHTERRLHQLMHEDRDYEAGPLPKPVARDQLCIGAAVIEERWRGRLSTDSVAMETEISIDSWKERRYSVVNVRGRDRPKLLFDTVCAVTDMKCVVFQAAISSHGPLAIQEYYIRHMDGCTLDTEGERWRVTKCLVAAVKRRVSHGLKVEVWTKNRKGLLSDVTRVLRENGLSLNRMECNVRGERAVGTFYVMNASGRGEVDPKRLETVKDEIGGALIWK